MFHLYGDPKYSNSASWFRLLRMMTTTTCTHHVVQTYAKWDKHMSWLLKYKLIYGSIINPRFLFSWASSTIDNDKKITYNE